MSACQDAGRKQATERKKSWQKQALEAWAGVAASDVLNLTRRSSMVVDPSIHVLEAGLEPAISSLGGRRLIH